MTCAWCESTLRIRPFSSSSRMAARAKDPLTFRRSTSPEDVISFICSCMGTVFENNMSGFEPYAGFDQYHMHDLTSTFEKHLARRGDTPILEIPRKRSSQTAKSVITYLTVRLTLGTSAKQREYVSSLKRTWLATFSLTFPLDHFCSHQRRVRSSPTMKGNHGRRHLPSRGKNDIVEDGYGTALGITFSIFEKGILLFIRDAKKSPVCWRQPMADDFA